MISKNKYTIFTFLISTLLIGTYYIANNAPENDVKSKMTEDEGTLPDKPMPSIQNGDPDRIIIKGEKEISLRTKALPIYLTNASTAVGIKLGEFLEKNQVGYIDTSIYPLSQVTEKHISQYIKQQKYILYDNSNTEVWTNLRQRFEDLSPSGIIANHLGGVGIGDESIPGLVLASSYINKETNQLEYMLIDIIEEESTEKTSQKVKDSFAFLEEQKRRIQLGIKDEILWSQTQTSQVEDDVDIYEDDVDIYEDETLIYTPNSEGDSSEGDSSEGDSSEGDNSEGDNSEGV